MKDADLILTNGIVVTGEGVRRADIAVQGRRSSPMASPRQR